MSEWQKIETAPKYPLDSTQHGPEFIALDRDWGAIQARWSFPQPGSIAYAENHSPQVCASNPIRNECIYLNPTHWMTLPEPPK
jgi:hypothetical protein